MLNLFRRAYFSTIAKKNYYDILQIKPNASLEQIKEAYRVQAMKYHPDVSTIDIHQPNLEKFTEIAEAYSILSNEHSRKQFDVLNKTEDLIFAQDKVNYEQIFKSTSKSGHN